MKTNITLIAAVLLAAFTMQSCTKDVLRGEGPTVTETRSLPAFTSVMVNGTRTVEIIPAPNWKVELTGYQNLVGAYNSYVSNGELRFEYPYHTSVRRDNISLRIYTPQFSKTTMSGETKVLVKNGFVADNLEAMLSGNGELRFEGGTANSVKFITSGNASVYAEPLQVKVANVEMSGNARIELRASQSLDVRISGNGEVHYWGSPSVTSSISGNGKTVKH